jgi:hypothetical protein
VRLGQLYSLTTSTLQALIRTQLNTALFAKTLVRKDVASSSASSSPSDAAMASSDTPSAGSDAAIQQKEKEDEFSSKAQIMTLMCAVSRYLMNRGTSYLLSHAGPQTSIASRDARSSFSSSSVCIQFHKSEVH